MKCGCEGSAKIPIFQETGEKIVCIAGSADGFVLQRDGSGWALTGLLIPVIDHTGGFFPIFHNLFL